MTVPLPQPAAQAGPQPTAGAAGPAGRSLFRRRPVLVAFTVAAVVAAGGATATALVFGPSAAGLGRPTAAVTPAAPPPAAPLPTVELVGVAVGGRAPVGVPAVIRATSGTIIGVTGSGPDGTTVTGAVGSDGTWTSSTGLVPSAEYGFVAQVTDTNGANRSVPLTVTTGAPPKVLAVTVSPGDGAVVGVGQAVSVRLGTPVKDKAARAEVERRLTVTAVPAVVGAWHWVGDSELRYRAETFWAAGTTVNVSAALDRLQAAPGVWGQGTRTVAFTVGSALTSVVDTQSHMMTVSKNGQVLRVMKASTGKPQFPTRNGTFVVLEKFADLVMDSSTVNLPPGTPAYKTAVKDAVRITNSGTFVHGAPWSVGSQGRENVSHGCVNLSPADADWFFGVATRGDVVTVVNSTTGPAVSDAGAQDWNMTFDQWKAGSALAA